MSSQVCFSYQTFTVLPNSSIWDDSLIQTQYSLFILLIVFILFQLNSYVLRISIYIQNTYKRRTSNVRIDCQVIGKYLPIRDHGGIII